LLRNSASSWTRRYKRAWNKRWTPQAPVALPPPSEYLNVHSCSTAVPGNLASLAPEIRWFERGWERLGLVQERQCESRSIFGEQRARDLCISASASLSEDLQLLIQRPVHRQPGSSSSRPGIGQCLPPLLDGVFLLWRRAHIPPPAVRCNAGVGWPSTKTHEPKHRRPIQLNRFCKCPVCVSVSVLPVKTGCFSG